MVLKEVEVDLTVVDVRTFTRKSRTTGQELEVESGNKYPARISCPDKEELDLTSLKRGDLCTFLVELGFQSMQCVSDNDKKYYKRVPTFFIKDIV